MKTSAAALLFFLVLSGFVQAQKYDLVDHYISYHNKKNVQDLFFYHEDKLASNGLPFQGWCISANITNDKFAETTIGPMWYAGRTAFGFVVGYDTEDKLRAGGQVRYLDEEKKIILFVAEEAGYSKDTKPVYWYYAFVTKTFNQLMVGGVIRQGYGLGPTVGWSLDETISLNFIPFWDYENLDAGSKFKPVINFKAIF